RLHPQRAARPRLEHDPHRRQARHRAQPPLSQAEDLRHHTAEVARPAHAPAMELTATAAHVVSVLAMGSVSRRRLQAAPYDAGRVHSAFDRVVNVEWHDGRLLAIHGPGRLLAPFAIALARGPSRAVRPGSRVHRRGDTIALDDVVLEWSAATTVETAMPKHADVRQGVATLLSALPEAEPSAGLSSVIGQRARARLAEGVRTARAGAFLEGALAMLGLGEGLTPAGDDC